MSKGQDVDDMFPFLGNQGGVSMEEFTSSSSGSSSRSSRNSSDEKEKLRSLAEDIKKKSGLQVYYHRRAKELRQKSPNAGSEERLKDYFDYPLKFANPEHPMFKKPRVKSPDITQEDPNVIKRREQEARINMSSRGKVDMGWMQARMRSQLRKQQDNKKFLDELPKIGGSKMRKKSRRFRNNFRKNKISRKYIMLKQCGGGKAKMGSKSKPYSSKRKAMRSRRRVCYYKKKGRTLKMKKKKKKSRKKSRRRRRR